MSSLKQGSMSKEKELPALPLMLLRAVPTMIRRQAPAEPNDLQFSFRAEAFDREHLERYKRTFSGFQSAVPLTYFYLLSLIHI